MGCGPTAAATKSALSPAVTESDAGCNVKTGATGLVFTVRTALELMAVPMGLLTITE